MNNIKSTKIKKIDIKANSNIKLEPDCACGGMKSNKVTKKRISKSSKKRRI